jgi:uncharacterized protein (TIGR02145 family)
MENLSNSKILKSKDFKIGNIENLIKLKYPEKFDQMILNDDIERKNVCFVRYKAKTLRRTVKIITFPLFKKIREEFKENYCIDNGSKVPVRNPTDLINYLLGMDGVKIKEYDKLNEINLTFYETPVETAEGRVLKDQPLYFIPSLTTFYTCKKCHGEQYVTCPDDVCAGRHEWTCTNCGGNGSITCKKCKGEGERTCEKCGGRHEYTCPTCGGKGELKCSHCGGSGWYNEPGKSGRSCPYCSGTGKRNCSLRSDSANIISAVYHSAADKEYCKGKGIIFCDKCKPNGKITCDNCKGSGEVTCKECDGDGKIVCSICYGDRERYGKVDCPNCHTMGEMGEIVIIETTIESFDTESLFNFGKSFPESNFPSNKQLELIKRHIDPNYRTKEAYFKLFDNTGNEISRENIDEYSLQIISSRRPLLKIETNKYPKLIEEYIYYEVVPSLTLSYKHILTNTVHNLSFIAVDSNDPSIVFHSSPDEKALVKQSFSERAREIISKAFSTKRYRNKIDKRNTIILLIHMAKADQVIEHSEKVYLSKLIQDLDNFTVEEKKLLFSLMSSSELPKIERKYARFTNKEKEEEVKKLLLELSELDGETAEVEKNKLSEINSLINDSRQSKSKRVMIDFMSAWQISIPVITNIILVILSLIFFWNEQNYGYLTINTHSMATVYVNEKPMINHRNIKLSPQIVSVKVTMPKTISLEQQIKLRRNDNLILDLFPVVQTGSIKIAVNPFDASIELIGDANEKFSAEGLNVFEDIPIGTYLIKVSANGYETHQETLALRNNERQSRSIQLEQSYDSLSNSTIFEEVLNTTTGRIWMDRNLGARQVAQSLTDEDAYGDLYQWGRGSDGHEKRTSNSTTTLSSTDTTGHGFFILALNEPNDWRSPQNSKLWQGAWGINNPCPSGYRLPTELEWAEEQQSWSTNNAEGAFNSMLKLPFAGYRNGVNDSLDYVGSAGFYWLADFGSISAGMLIFSSDDANMRLGRNSYGLSIRCIKD